MPLLIKCSSPFAAPRHPHLRAPPHVCCHVCCAHAQPCLSTGWALNRRFGRTSGTAAVLAQGGGGKSNRCCFRQVLELWCCSHKGGGGFGGVRVRERVWGLWEGQPMGPVNGKRLWLARAGSVLREDEGQ